MEVSVTDKMVVAVPVASGKVDVINSVLASWTEVSMRVKVS